MKREESKFIQRGWTAEWWRLLTKGERQQKLAELSSREIDEFFYDWRVWARDSQLPPDWDWDTWLMLCGRGFGKTRTAVEFLNEKVQTANGVKLRIAIVGQGADDVRNVMVEGEALALDTPIPTPDGWRNFGDLEPGDRVFARDGSITRVVGITPVWNDRPCYAVVADRAAAIVADANHKWVSSSRADRRPDRERREQIRTTEEMAVDVYRRRPDLCEYEVPMAGALDLPPADLVVPPYTLGAWLGDGDTRGQGTFTCHPDDVETIENIRLDGFEVGERVGSYAWGIKKLKVGLRALGLLGRKSIPASYLRASVDQRLALLQGLMDTDGYVSARGQCSFDNTNHMLVLQVRELLLTLGFKPGAIQSKVDGRGFKTMHRITFTCAAGSPSPFRLKRKVDRCYGARRPGGRLVRSITRVASVPVRCIQVEHPTGTFLAGEDFVVTHNSGFINCAPPWNKPTFYPSKGGGALIWPNGCQAFIYSIADTEALRGPQFHYGWCDEPMAAPRVQRERAIDNLEFCLRLGDHPQLLITTTPKSDPWLREMEKQSRDPANKIAITRGTTHDNAENLAGNFLKKIVRKYGGTRKGRQEIEGKILGDEENALWTEDLIEACRLKDEHPLDVRQRCVKVVVGVDPNTKSNSDQAAAKKTKIAHAAGIVVVGSLPGRKRVVLADRSIGGGPDKWGKAVVAAAEEFDADEVYCESNQGGEMVRIVVRGAMDELDFNIPIFLKHNHRSKVGRAEPVAQRYEQGDIQHVGESKNFENLEMQMVYLHEGEDPTGEDFDRVDALVMGMTRLGLKKRAASAKTGRGAGIRTMGEMTNGASDQGGIDSY